MRSSALTWRTALLVPLVVFASGCGKHPTSPTTQSAAHPLVAAPAPAPAPAPEPPPDKTKRPVYLHGIGANANPATLTLDGLAPSAPSAKYKDSPAVRFSGGNAWVEVGTWIASPKLTNGTLSALGDLQVWLGLKNSDDIGTNFDVRAELYKNEPKGGTLVASGETDCILGLTRNPALAKAVGVAFNKFKPVTFDGGKETLSLKLLTRIGTDGSGSPCGGHSNAVGLRAYFDAELDPAMFFVLFGNANTRATVDVTVVDEKTNAPISGAYVYLKYEAAPPKDQPPPGTTSGTTDDNGEVELTDQLVGIPVIVVANVSEICLRSAHVTLDKGFTAGLNAVTVSVPPLSGGLLSGVVSDIATGTGLAGVAVTVLPDGNNVVGGTGTEFYGNYSFGCIQPGTYSMTFELAGYATRTVSGVSVVAGGSTVQNAQLTALPPPPPPDATVDVSVIDSQTLAGLAGAEVTIIYSDGSPAATAQTDASGNVQFTNQPVGVSATISVNDVNSGRSKTMSVSAGFISGANSPITVEL